MRSGRQNFENMFHAVGASLASRWNLLITTSYKHKFLKRLDMYHDLKFDEKEQHNTEKENEEYLKELERKL